MILGFVQTILKILRLSQTVYFGGRPIWEVDIPCGRWGALDKVSSTVDFGRLNSVAIWGAATPAPANSITIPLL